MGRPDPGALMSVGPCRMVAMDAGQEVELVKVAATQRSACRLPRRVVAVGEAMVAMARATSPKRIADTMIKFDRQGTDEQDPVILWRVRCLS